MAFGMKQWLGVTAVGLALVAAWRLPPESNFRQTGQTGTVKAAERIRYDALEKEARLTGEILRRVLWSDSLSALVVDEAEEGVVVLSPPVDEPVREQRGRLVEQIRAEIAERTPDGPKATFGYIYQPHDLGRLDGVSISARDRTETYAGTREGVDYCLQVRVLDPRFVPMMLASKLTGNDRTAPRTDALGPCRFYVTYGLAGASIQEWLESGGAGLAVEAGAEPLPIDVPPGYRYPVGRRSMLGFVTSSRSEAFVVNRCLAGDAPACASLFTDPAKLIYRSKTRLLDIARSSPVTSIGRAPYESGPLIRDVEYLLADLEAEFGVEAFRAFWTSDRDVGESFEAAFGLDAGTWLVGWIGSSMGIDPPGPGLPRRASGGALITVGLLLGIAYLRNREREVGS